MSLSKAILGAVAVGVGLYAGYGLAIAGLAMMLGIPRLGLPVPLWMLLEVWPVLCLSVIAVDTLERHLKTRFKR
ncbi:MAG: hypothetical protein LAP40_22985 [Acidobacteriia bacterium]|nr:hypothetical protein [Terriglobia bacterium]